jgi:cholesterol transport system auxiliary component
MRLLMKTGTAIALAAALSGCSVSSLLGGGGSGKPPVTLQTLTAEAADPGAIARSSAAGQAVTVAIPATPKELKTIRVPVQLTPTDIQYVTNFRWLDTPDRLFQQLLEETIRRTTNRVVLNPLQSSLDPGMTVSGELGRFGYDASTGQVVVIYDAALGGRDRVETRRFTASVPADGTAGTVGPALNRAANQVAQDVAKWIGNSAG